MKRFFRNEKGYIDEEIIAVIVGIVVIVAILFAMIYGELHGFTDYKASNDKDLARITAVTQKQEGDRVYYQVDVEYLTNTPTQDGVLQKKEIEKDTFYCYYEDEELVKQLQDNLYKEVWIITGYKGGYETYKDFGDHLIKRIELKEE
ncbi:MAG: hypothetical protein IKF38_04985 [Clostridia bacterium]|nr:hypothetical protein [Clostridia bacterium]